MPDTLPGDQSRNSIVFLASGIFSRRVRSLRKALVELYDDSVGVLERQRGRFFPVPWQEELNEQKVCQVVNREGDLNPSCEYFNPRNDCVPALQTIARSGGASSAENCAANSRTD